MPTNLPGQNQTKKISIAESSAFKNLPIKLQTLFASVYSLYVFEKSSVYNSQEISENLSVISRMVADIQEFGVS